jgi:aerobic-type carbon monoxide dehydrogenase small subunit (CoxS/CutS family)
MINLTVNGRAVSLDAEPDMPLLWAVREELKLTGSKFGCGAAQCGACTMHVAGAPVRACLTPISSVEGAQVVTIEGIAKDAIGQAVQAAWVEHDVAQCGYCQSGTGHERRCAAEGQQEAQRRADRRGHGRQPVPLWHLPPHPRRHPCGRGQAGLRRLTC